MISISAMSTIPANILQTLKSLESSEDELKSALLQLRKILYSLHTERRNKKLLNALKREIISLNIHSILLGIIRSYSRDVDIVASTTNCISLLVHENEEVRVSLGDKNALKTLSSFLIASHPLYPGVHLSRAPRSHAPFYHHIDEVLLAIQKLIYINGHNTKLFLDCDGLSLVVQLCDRVRHNPSLFSAEPKGMFYKYTRGEALQASMVVADPEECERYRDCFEALRCHSDLYSNEYNFHHIRLAAYAKDDPDVAMAMVKEGVAWEQQLKPVPEDHTFEVRVSHVEHRDSVCLAFWCQLYDSQWSQRLSAMYTSLQLLELAKTSVTMAAPQVGMVYAVYNDATLDQSELDFSNKHKGWFRGRVLFVHQNEPHLSVTVLAIDMGFTTTVSLSKLRPLPKECQGIPDQAVPCVLDGVQPIPQYLNTIRRALGVLLNLTSFGHRARSQFIMMSGSMTLLRSFIEWPDFEIVKTALTVLANMVQHKQSKNHSSMVAMVPFVLDCCKAFVNEVELLELSLKYLINALYESVPNRVKFIEVGGIQVILDLQLLNMGDVETLLTQVLSNVLGDLDLSHVDGRLAILVREEKKNPLRPDARTGNMLRRSRSTSDTFSWLTAEKTDKKSCLLSVDTPPLDTPLVDSPPLDTPSGIHRDHYMKEEQIVCNKQTQQFVEGIQGTEELLGAHVCAFLNSFTGGTIYLGVSGNGAVKGLSLSRSQVDQFYTRFDAIWSRIKPIPSPSMFKVEPIPVIDGSSPSSSLHSRRDYVIELRVSCSSLTPVYQVVRGGGRCVCYVRQNGGTAKVGCVQDLRKLIIQESLLTN